METAELLTNEHAECIIPIIIFIHASVRVREFFVSNIRDIRFDSPAYRTNLNPVTRLAKMKRICLDVATWSW